MGISFDLPKHGDVIDINGSRMALNLRSLVEDQFLRPYSPDHKPVLPDELLYTDTGLGVWRDIIHHPNFYQTYDEMALFDKHGSEIASQVQRDTVLIDLGAGDTQKVEHLLAVFEEQKVPCTYLALDISKKSLDENIRYLESKHSSSTSVVKCAGLWGTFEDGMSWVQQVKGQRLFLSLGSVLCNDPWPEALRKVKDWAGILRSDDLLLVGMDAHLVPQDREKIWKAYHSMDDLYREFFLNGFRHANLAVGEDWFKEEDWELKAELECPTRHRFFFRAKHDFQLGSSNRKIKEGEEFDWFDSHKYGQEDVETMFEKAGLIASNVWQAPDSCMYI